MGWWLQYRINVAARSSLIWSAFLFPFHLWTKGMNSLLSAFVQASTKLEVPCKQNPCLLPQNLTLWLPINGVNFYFVFISAVFFPCFILDVTYVYCQGAASVCYSKLCFLELRRTTLLWTWVWVNSKSWWWTGKPGMLRFMGSQRVGHDWATELNWTELYYELLIESSYCLKFFLCLYICISICVGIHIHKYTC